MSEQVDQAVVRDTARKVTGLWWLWLISGIAWVIVALVVLQFDSASATTVGVIIGLMFLFSGIEQLFMATVADSMRWVWALFGVLLVVAGVISLIQPKSTFAGIADILGFLFLLVGVFWTVQAFIDRADNDLWWIGLVSGILMIILAFWTSGQFLIDKAFLLLVFAGVWALLHGLNDFVKAFALRSAHKQL
ncbi:HdeD family acid-resistance protein [Capillimicrobium parvum]|uniref:HdeD family acid-resistance protein n=1 Tax=Capillimicrobium parvum TaxID=2884022 RepID=A0A9E6XSX9_9ACTN|nr:DUF308 domain-containing protein [Capillimicrobium parvum]UGS34022.1 hypothetical protein DSM104329_00392 [Capillimicrobium parvum]